ncbi:Sec-independent protein translocase protein TatB [Roseibium sediminis]|uniref:Sec-independent protein translocase protein TatB n=1 Tax=Roseibium sediminis TaxID=1775174 RepID=UPI00123E41D2|nr:Sec-independent protein translocase protein TatB [Roseibium sediminis]
MFDIGWTELLVIACVAIIVVGPKDLPKMLRTLGQTMGKMRKLSREFQSTFNDALREAEQQADIADMKKQVEAVGNFNPLGDLKKSIEEDFKGKSAAASKPASAKVEAPAATAAAPTATATAATAPSPAATTAPNESVSEENKA